MRTSIAFLAGVAAAAVTVAVVDRLLNPEEYRPVPRSWPFEEVTTC